MGTILSIYSDEAEDATGNGDGSTVNDIVITGKSSFKVRAERLGKGNGRVYGVNFKVTDTSGAVQTATSKFVVPHRDIAGGAGVCGMQILVELESCGVGNGGCGAFDRTVASHRRRSRGCG
jgi:hypothetical protein